MRILAIETSCDETAISLIETKGGYPDTRLSVAGNVILSQAQLHAQYGGVYPNLAKREHAKNLLPILSDVLTQTKEHIPFNAPLKAITPELQKKLSELFQHEEGLAEAMIAALPTIPIPKIDQIAVTAGPGLEPALWVGINFAKGLSLAWDIPVVAINHMEGHLVSSLIAEPSSTTPAPLRTIQFPALVLLVSGGHTEIILMEALHTYRTIGKTRDDAAGECFDKVARMLELPYPGGPEISRFAAQGKPNKAFELPRPMLHSGDFDFSFSGLKTAVLYLLRDKGALSNEERADLAYEFEVAVADILTRKAIAAAKETGAQTIILGGGVSANARLREALAQETKKALPDVEFFVPPFLVSTDNALMIGLAAALRAEKEPPASPDTIRANGNWTLFRDKR